MADRVQYRLERMVDELDDLEQRGLFARREIDEIVRQRRKFEYRLGRPSPLKVDYLNYIEYETHLDALRQLRKKAVARELKKQGNKKMKKSKSDVAGVTRIIGIYERAVRRYKGDVDLWFRYLEFCRKRKNGRMKRALAKVVRFHPKVPGVWIYAAAWEFDHNLNAAAARVLMQSGLRMCPISEDLWIEYLRMELTYVNKLKARKVALGQDEGTLLHDKKTVDEKQWRDENKDLFLSIDEKRETNDESNVEREESKKKPDSFVEHGLSIFRTIYTEALEALPSSLSLRKRFFEIFEATKLANSEEMRKQILNDMKRDFSTAPEYWDWLARLEYDPQNVHETSEEVVLPQIQNAVQIFEDGFNNSAFCQDS
ncbi:U3 small nucleolar RNA-associated protein 6-like protein [Quillaja saponaria]|uniref:U3 small nucleolar RNA-associated protein 6-like protein n=1 Tax=Quillaja saponaria TaxID=32244 RepID=A0AAD7KWC1_QUISA|nr:U3 small nucleolar RNA-associated protein 6-like protein [Quillaja saponaria]